MVQATGVAFEDRPTSRSTRHMMAGAQPVSDPSRVFPLQRRTLRVGATKFLCLRLFNTSVKTGAAVLYLINQRRCLGLVLAEVIKYIDKHRREKYHVRSCFQLRFKSDILIKMYIYQIRILITTALIIQKCATNTGEQGCGNQFSCLHLVQTWL